ncbi:GreA/GreB family elongation factor [Maribellus sp. YY47]|uniref:GreA/GreB family elongation factor n=1 Tax=Maribellus sp. YY47 TaxID=2929486 RepID=UPI0020017D5A|nr:GreA/GreB family elongation factor [Maribellus sp. YY47]MCK3685090.1 GreA/GreB family elongation factor [Maribellus sp. YY47]
MVQSKNIKPLIIEKLNEVIQEKIMLLTKAISGAKESRDNETKSSVGDKYETGRAMVQMEMEKTQAQLSLIENQKASLSRIDLNRNFSTVEFGSLVKTNLGTYFISIAFGKIETGDETVFCLSPVSPVGKALAGKKAGDKVMFQGKSIEIRTIH